MLISVTMIACLSLNMLACGSENSAPVADSEAADHQLLDFLSISEGNVPMSSTPATDSDNTKYNEKVLPDAGVTLNLPEEFVNTDGYIYYSSQDISSGNGIYYASAIYYGVTEEEFFNYLTKEEVTEEETEALARQADSIFFIFGIDDNRSLTELVDYINEGMPASEKYSESSFHKLTTVDGCTFYEFTGDAGFNSQFQDEYATEYETLISLKDELIRNATFTAPERPFANLVGSKLSFTTKDIDGNTITSDEIFSQHEVTMLNVWATWCHYCIEELPDLETLNKELSQKDCAIVGLLGDGTDQKTINDGLDIMAESGVTYLNILPWDGWDTSLEVKSWPTSFYVDRNGYVVCLPIVGASVSKYGPRIDSILSGEISLSDHENNVLNDSGGAYRIFVVDKDKNPVSGVTVQFCANDICKMAVTGESGMVSFNDEESVYEVHILKAPDNYKPDNNVYYTEDKYCDLTLILEKK